MNGLTKNEVSETVFAKPILANGVTDEILWLKLSVQSTVARPVLNPLSLSPVGAVASTLDAEVDGFAIDSDMEPKIGVAKSIHEGIGSRRRRNRGCCGRVLNKIEREANVGLEGPAKAVTKRRVRLHHET